MADTCSAPVLAGRRRALRWWARSRLALVWVVGLAVQAAPAAGQAADSAPVTLRQLLDGVSRGHPLIEAARARVRAARGAGTTAGLPANPVLSFQVENAAWPGRPAPPLDRETMITAMLPLESFYQRWPRAGRARASVRAAEADSAAERQRVGLDAAQAFYRTALAQVALEAARNVADWLDTIVAYNQARVNEGVTAEADLIRTQLERDRATAEAALAEADLARARADLATFLELASATAATVVAAPPPAPLPLVIAVPPETHATAAATASALTVRGLDLRPDVRAARERVAAARAGVVSEWSMLFRELGAMVGTKRSAGTTSLMFGVSLPVPLFDQNRGEIARAAAERDAAMFELAARERAARSEVSGAYRAAVLLSQRLEPLARGPQGYLARADEARHIALGAYREGAVPLFQVIDAARAWSEARVTFHQALYAQHESVLALVAAQGLDLAMALQSDSSLGATGAAR